jgi:hypothetical protein
MAKCCDFTMGPSGLLPSDLALVLQYGSGLVSNFLAKILDIGTHHFFGKHSFFALSSLLLHTLIKGSIFISSLVAQVVACFLVVLPIHVPFPSRFLFLSFFNYHVYFGCGSCQI